MRLILVSFIMLMQFSGVANAQDCISLDHIYRLTDEILEELLKKHEDQLNECCCYNNEDLGDTFQKYLYFLEYCCMTYDTDCETWLYVWRTSTWPTSTAGQINKRDELTGELVFNVVSDYKEEQYCICEGAEPVACPDTIWTWPGCDIYYFVCEDC